MHPAGADVNGPDGGTIVREAPPNARTRLEKTMSDILAEPDDEYRVEAEGTDPDIPSTDDLPAPEETSPAEEDDEDIDLEDLP